MGYLVDTNVLSELRKKQRCNENVRLWFDGTENNAIYISVLTIGEIRRGIEKIQKRDEVAAISLENWLQQVKKNARGRILPITEAISNRWGMINAGDPLPVIDSFLAATALEHDLVLVTRNISDVERSGARLLNPFDENK
jgi:predicted nucleic acid-binding protein